MIWKIFPVVKNFLIINFKISCLAAYVSVDFGGVSIACSHLFPEFPTHSNVPDPCVVPAKEKTSGKINENRNVRKKIYSVSLQRIFVQ